MSPEEIDAILDLEPEELGIRIIRNARASETDNIRFGNGMLAFDTIFKKEIGNTSNNSQQVRQKLKLLERAYREAWSWLEASAFLIWPDTQNGSNGYRVLSRRAKKMSVEEMKLFADAKGLSREHLHPRIATKVWSEFIRGQFDTAVFIAAKAVEVSVRDKTGIEETGVSLMRSAFKKKIGPLADTSTNEGEQEARMHLFAGFIGSYKNPGSHRDVNMENPVEAMQVVMFASHLLHLVDQVGND